MILLKRKVKGYNLNNITSGFNALYKRVNGQDFKIVFKETKILKRKNNKKPMCWGPSFRLFKILKT